MPAELASSTVATDADRLLQAEDAVRAWCGWHIAPVRTATFTFTAWDCSAVVLPTLRVVEVLSVVNANGVLLEPDAYEVTQAGVLSVTRSYGWGYGYNTRRLTVTYTHGHENPPPAVTAVVQALATRAGDNPGSLVREQVGPFANTYSQSSSGQSVPLGLLDAERALLAPYRLPARP